MPDLGGDPAARAPGVGSASYWSPRHLLKSAWLEHAPFGAWLMSVARPRSVVELGTHNGFSLFVFAETARRLAHDVRITAIDSWEGDDQAGYYGDEIYEGVRQIAERDYPGMITLVRARFSEAVERVPDGSVDLLHIDGRHGYDDVLEDWELYRPKLSDRGIALFHDTREFQPSFGVHRFWDELSAREGGFTFEHEHGLGVLVLGQRAPAEVTEFLRAARSDPTAIRAFYSEQGARVGASFWDHDAMSLVRQERDEARAQLDEAESHLHDARVELHRLHRTLSWRITTPLRWIRRRGT